MGTIRLALEGDPYAILVSFAAIVTGAAFVTWNWPRRPR